MASQRPAIHIASPLPATFVWGLFCRMLSSVLETSPFALEVLTWRISLYTFTDATLRLATARRAPRSVHAWVTPLSAMLEQCFQPAEAEEADMQALRAALQQIEDLLPAAQLIDYPLWRARLTSGGCPPVTLAGATAVCSVREARPGRHVGALPVSISLRLFIFPMK